MLTVGCAGGMDTVLTLPFHHRAAPPDAAAYRLRVGGLQGGHSGADIHLGRANAILMPHVIRFNGTHPSKPATWPKYNFYKADEKYQNLAKMLGLPASTPAEGVESYAKACADLAESVGIVMNLAAQKITPVMFAENIDLVSMMAYEDQCTPCNPRLPLVSDLKAILKQAYGRQE